MRRRARDPLAWYADLKPDLIRRTAYVALLFRLIEATAGLVLFRHSFAGSLSWPLPVELLFGGYGVANVLLCAWYRTRQVTRHVVLVDLGINLIGTVWMSTLTGGLESPIVLLGFVKIAGYGFLFSPGLGSFAFMTTLASFMPLFAVELLLPRVGEQAGAPYGIELVVHTLALSAILLGTAWLFDELAGKERDVSREAERAREAARREHAAAEVTGALLAVSEAVSRLTRPEDVLHKVVEVAPRVLAVDYCTVLLWHDDTQTYRSAALRGLEPAIAARADALRLGPADAPNLEWVRRLGHCAVVNALNLSSLGLEETPAVLMAPLLSGARFYGVIQFARRGGQNTFTQRDLAIADGIASQTAIAFERARLEDESRRLARAVESTAEAVVITDPDGRAVFANQAFLDLSGAPLDRVLGRPVLADILDVSTVPDARAGASLLGHNWQGEVALRRVSATDLQPDAPTPADVPVHVTVSVIRAPEGHVQGAVALLQDVSAQKELQHQMQRADRLAAAGELAAGVAHEVNNALVSILAQAERAHVDADAAALREALLRVETQGQRIADIVQRLLRFARPPTPQRDAIDVPTLVRDTIELMAHDLERARVHTAFAAAGGVPLVIGDTKLVQQVLVNLFTNAAQAMEPAGGTMRVTVDAQPLWIAIEVHDTGRGIPPDDLPRIFDPFFSSKESGTGLGLSVSYAIVQAHGGELLVQSTPGSGTTFTLRLPTAGGSAPRARTALVVDDDDAVAATLMTMLSRDGLQVTRAATGRAALATLQAASFDVVFLDLRLPDLSGEEVYAHLAAAQPATARRVIFVTGGLWRPDGGSLRGRLPPQPTLSKPCTLAQIREALRRLDEQRAAA